MVNQNNSPAQRNPERCSMNQRFWPSLLALIVVIATLATACAQPVATVPPATPAARATPTIAAPAGLNPVALGGLAGATRIDVLAFDSAPAGGAQPGYVQRLAITDSNTVQQVLATLNADLKPLPKAACIPEYELSFQLAGGAVQKLGFSCQGASFLRGDQPAWRDQDVQPPAAFDALMRDLLAAPAPKP
jgi:hypothetical protein